MKHKRFRLRRWHYLSIAALALVGVMLLWFALAYGGLPRLWSRHEHKKIGQRDAITAFTAQDIPADPINLHLRGDIATLSCLFQHAGWSRADDVSLGSGLHIVASVLLFRPYPQAPVSPLYVKDKIQDVAFEKPDGRSADRRHHVRFWQIAPGDWLAAATYDRGVGLSLFTLQVTHRIGPDVDADRNAAVRLLRDQGARLTGSEPSRIPPGQWRRNGGGDRYITDGRIVDLTLPPGCSGS